MNNTEVPHYAVTLHSPFTHTSPSYVRIFSRVSLLYVDMLLRALAVLFCYGIVVHRYCPTFESEIKTGRTLKFHTSFVIHTANSLQINYLYGIEMDFGVNWIHELSVSRR